jgi:hypothetical protein
MGILGVIYAAVPSVVWKFLGIVAIAGSLYAAGDLHGRRIEHAKCEAAAKAAQEAANAQDIQAAKDNERAAVDTANQLTEQKKEDDATIQALQTQLKLRPADAPCLYGDGGDPASVVRKQPSKGTRDPKHPGSARVPATVPSATRN